MRNWNRRLGTAANPLISQPGPSGLTPYGVIRVGEDTNEADLVFTYALRNIEMASDSTAGGSVAHVPGRSIVSLDVSTGGTDLARMRTQAYLRYSAGKASDVRQILFHSDSGQTNQVRRWGLYDDNDGLFWELNETTLRLVRRTSTSGSPVDNVLATQAEFNVDRMDGDGPSGQTLDLTTASAYEMQIQWYGAGANIQFFINQFLVHKENFSNRFANPYTATMTLPMQWEVRNTGASTAGGFHVLGSLYETMGQEPHPQQVFGIGRTAVVSVGPSPGAPIIGLRPKATFNTLVNRGILFPFALLVENAGSRCAFDVYAGPGILNDGTWASVSPESHAEWNESATQPNMDLTNAVKVYSGALADGTAFDAHDVFEHLFTPEMPNRGLLLQDYTDTPRELAVVARDLGGGTTSVFASLNWRESL